MSPIRRHEELPGRFLNSLPAFAVMLIFGRSASLNCRWTSENTNTHSAEANHAQVALMSVPGLISRLPSWRVTIQRHYWALLVLTFICLCMHHSIVMSFASLIVFQACLPRLLQLEFFILLIERGLSTHFRWNQWIIYDQQVNIVLEFMIFRESFNCDDSWNRRVPFIGSRWFWQLKHARVRKDPWTPSQYRLDHWDIAPSTRGDPCGSRQRARILFLVSIFLIHLSRPVTYNAPLQWHQSLECFWNGIWYNTVSMSSLW